MDTPEKTCLDRIRTLINIETLPATAMVGMTREADIMVSQFQTMEEIRVAP